MTVGLTSGSSTAAELFTSPATNTLFWQNWGTFQYTFVPTATSATLQFSVTDQQFDVGLDDVSISAASSSVPEPCLGHPCGQKTRRGPNPPEQSRFLFLIDVSVSAAFN
jgi:hypothetical protein